MVVVVVVGIATSPSPWDLSCQEVVHCFCPFGGALTGECVSGAATFTMHTDAGTETSYEQKFNLIWANLDTGRNGGAEVVAKVHGPDNVLSIPAVRTEPGRIALVLQAFNHGNDENRSFGDCSAEYTVV